MLESRPERWCHNLTFRDEDIKTGNAFSTSGQGSKRTEVKNEEIFEIKCACYIHTAKPLVCTISNSNIQINAKILYSKMPNLSI